MEKEAWTHGECVGLASEFNTKPRYVIALVHAMGRTYIDSELDNQAAAGAGEQSAAEHT